MQAKQSKHSASHRHTTTATPATRHGWRVPLTARPFVFAVISLPHSTSQDPTSLLLSPIPTQTPTLREITEAWRRRGALPTLSTAATTTANTSSILATSTRKMDTDCAWCARRKLAHDVTSCSRTTWGTETRCVRRMLRAKSSRLSRRASRRLFRVRRCRGVRGVSQHTFGTLMAAISSNVHFVGSGSVLLVEKPGCRQCRVPVIGRLPVLREGRARSKGWSGRSCEAKRIMR